MVIPQQYGSEVVWLYKTPRDQVFYNIVLHAKNAQVILHIAYFNVPV